MCGHGRDGKEQHHYEMFIHRTKCNDHCLTEKEENLCGEIMVGVGLGIVLVITVIIVFIWGT